MCQIVFLVLEIFYNFFNYFIVKFTFIINNPVLENVVENIYKWDKSLIFNDVKVKKVVDFKDTNITFYAISEHLKELKINYHHNNLENYVKPFRSIQLPACPDPYYYAGLESAQVWEVGKDLSIRNKDLIGKNIRSSLHKLSELFLTTKEGSNFMFGVDFSAEDGTNLQTSWSQFVRVKSPPAEDKSTWISDSYSLPFSILVTDEGTYFIRLKYRATVINYYRYTHVFHYYVIFEPFHTSWIDNILFKYNIHPANGIPPYFYTAAIWLMTNLRKFYNLRDFDYDDERRNRSYEENHNDPFWYEGHFVRKTLYLKFKESLRRAEVREIRRKIKRARAESKAEMKRGLEEIVKKHMDQERDKQTLAWLLEYFEKKRAFEQFRRARMAERMRAHEEKARQEKEKTEGVDASTTAGEASSTTEADKKTTDTKTESATEAIKKTSSASKGKGKGKAKLTAELPPEVAEELSYKRPKRVPTASAPKVESVSKEDIAAISEAISESAASGAGAAAAATTTTNTTTSSTDTTATSTNPSITTDLPPVLNIGSVNDGTLPFFMFAEHTPADPFDSIPVVIDEESMLRAFEAGRQMAREAMEDDNPDKHPDQIGKEDKS